MAREFIVEDVRLEEIEAALLAAGSNDAGESFKIYHSELNRVHVGSIIRLENESGSGFEVGRVHSTIGSFNRQVLVMTTFNSDCQLLANVMTHLAMLR